MIASMARVLGRQVGPDDDFFAAGGDSLGAAEVAAQVAPGMVLQQLFAAGATPTSLAQAITGEAVPAAAGAATLHLSHGSGSAPALVWVLQHGRQIQIARGVARRLGSHVSVVALTPPPPDPLMRLEDLVEWYRPAMFALGERPVWLVAACLGPVVALELARRHRAVSGLAVVDPVVSDLTARGRLAWHLDAIRTSGAGAYLRSRFHRRMRLTMDFLGPGEAEGPWPAVERDLSRDALFAGRGLIIRSIPTVAFDDRARRPWRKRIGNPIQVDFTEDHAVLYTPRGFDLLSRELAAALDQPFRGHAPGSIHCTA